MGARRSRKSPEERRGEILDAALRLFADQGFDGTTMSDLAEAAGVAAGTLYLYFPSKEHVLAALHDRFHAGLQAALAEGGGEALARLAGKSGPSATEPAAVSQEAVGSVIDAVFDALVAYSLEQRDVYEVLIRYAPRLETGEDLDEDEPLVASLGWVLREGVRGGVLEVSDPETTARLLYYAMREGLAGAVVRRDEAEAWRIAAAAKELARKALRPLP